MKKALLLTLKFPNPVIELADGGSLFLDEIAELNPNLQAKLLRVLQERQFRRLGSTKLIKVDLRIISATNVNPVLAIAENKLRQDLYYRLNVVPIYIPPLRERREDIPLLINYFINKLNPSFPDEIKGISNDAKNILKTHNWPGNVRELENVIEQMMSLTENEIISIDDIPIEITTGDTILPEENFENLNFKDAKEKFLNKFSKQYINKLLAKYNGNISKVARKSGISRWTIYQILKN